jgi:hypothetical protein
MDANPEHKSSTGLGMLLIGCFIVIAPFALAALLRAPFIYDRDFNRIKARLERLPETTIIDSWRHEDMTLEDFGFDLKVRQCPPIRLDFYEGRDWYRTFGGIDGITFSKPYNPASNDYETICVSSNELVQAGIRVGNLVDIVCQLEAILVYLKSRPRGQVDTPRRGAYYIRIYYDLDAYKGKTTI